MIHTHLCILRQLGAQVFLVQAFPRAQVPLGTVHGIRGWLARGVASSLRPRVLLLEVAVLYLNIRRTRFYLLIDIDGRARGILPREQRLHACLLLRQLGLFPSLVAQGRVRSDIGVFPAVQRTLDVVFRFLDGSCALLPIWYLTLNLFKHDRESSKPILVAELPLLPETALVVVEGLLPLSCVRTVRHVGSVRDHVEQRLALVADRRHVLLLFLQAVLVLLPPFAEFDVAEFGYLRQLLIACLLLVFLDAHDASWQLSPHHDAFVRVPLVHLENVFVSCSTDHAHLARVSVSQLFTRRLVSLAGRVEFDASGVRPALVGEDSSRTCDTCVVESLLRTDVRYQI